MSPRPHSGAGVWRRVSGILYHICIWTASGITYLFPFGAWKSLEKKRWRKNRHEQGGLGCFPFRLP